MEPSFKVITAFFRTYRFVNSARTGPPKKNAKHAPLLLCKREILGSIYPRDALTHS